MEQPFFTTQAGLRAAAGSMLIRTAALSAWRPSLLLIATLALSGCLNWSDDGAAVAEHSGEPGWLNWPAGPAATPPIGPAAAPAIVAAERLLGTPYLWGGADPRGFDCSGLIFYVYRQLGNDRVPRTTLEQYQASASVSRGQMRAGDLVFFAIDGRRVSHVGLYAGEGRFIHAPSPGSQVSWANLNDSYWNARFAGAGRF